MKAAASSRSGTSARTQQPHRSLSRPIPRSRIVGPIRASSNPAGTEKFDYVIVGGGTAGCVLANRLSADSSKRVLVLEAGPGGEAPEVRAPAGLPKLFKHPIFDWQLMSKLQQQLAVREIYLARGKRLGGSSCTNATLYHRGSAADYDSWNLDGWRSKDVLDWFINAENYSGGASRVHGSGGIMEVEQPRYENVLHEEFFAAAKAAGLKPNPDFNDWSRSQEGFGEFQVTQKRGKRADMYQQHLKSAMNRGNLKVLTNTITTKVQIDKVGGTPKALGVEFAVSKGSSERFTAELKEGGEVLMCSGTVATPSLLMLSGLGPKQHLSDLGIPVIADLQGLGQNLQDHPATLTAFQFKAGREDTAVTNQIYDKNYNIRIDAILKWLLLGTGPLTTTGCDHGAFVNTTGKGDPDLQIRFVPGMSLTADGIGTYQMFAELQKEKRAWPAGITFQLLGCRAQSKGTVGLKSANPFDLPAVDINYFTDPEGADIATMKAGIALTRRIAASGEFAKCIDFELHPSAGITSDADLDAYIRKTVHSGNALVGTCKMGQSVADGSVVSHRDLRVFGVDGLRIVDASVLPCIPGGQTGAPTVMVAERAAAMLTAAQPAVPAAMPRGPLVAA